MPDRWHVYAMSFLALVAAASSVGGRTQAPDPPRSLAGPVEDGPFLRPPTGKDAEPTWGIKGGIAVGLWPNGGPRGLIRVYTPYLDQGRHRVMNFVAVEPVARGSRGLSELEESTLDHAPGKAMWTADSLENDPKVRQPWQPARGVVGTTGGKKTLSFYVYLEPFANGARPVVEVQLREDRPHEVAFRVFSARGGVPMRACVLTATMGNFARLRKLWLKDRVEERTSSIGRPGSNRTASPTHGSGASARCSWSMARPSSPPGPTSPTPWVPPTPAMSTPIGTIRAKLRPSTGVRRLGATWWRGSTLARPTGRRRRPFPEASPLRTSSWKLHSIPARSSSSASHPSRPRHSGFTRRERGIRVEFAP